jgi:histidyl-tRNA synthetase
VDVYPEPANKKIGKQFKYAGERGFAFAAALGDDELAKNTVTFKDLRSQTQETVSRSEAVTYLKGRLQARRGERPEA